MKHYKEIKKSLAGVFGKTKFYYQAKEAIKKVLGNYISIAEMEELCPSCAEEMKKLKISRIRLPNVQSKISGPKEVNKYYKNCMERYDEEAYCARVAWSIFCAHVDSDHPSCTKFGKEWGKPYISPVSKKD
jgi:hypothetical protein